MYDPNINIAIIRTDNILERVKFYDAPHLVECSGNYTKDSISIKIYNPRQLPINYYIYQLNKLVKEGTTQKKLFNFTTKNKTGKVYTIKYEYNWAGYRQREEKEFSYQDKKLQIHIEQPESILPGEQVSVKVKVLNHEKKAAPNVNLTVWAVNAAFDKNKSYILPKYPIQMSRFFKDFPFYSEEPRTLEAEFDCNQSLYNDFGLERSLEYRVRYPEKGIMQQYRNLAHLDTVYQNIAQFSPYIAKDGKLQKVWLLYIDNELIYFHKANQSQPYSFIADEGFHQISIRTKDALYTIDSVYFKKGNKLEFAFDENHYFYHPSAKYFKRDKSPKQLTAFEKALILDKILIVKDSWNLEEADSWFFKQSNHNIHQIPKLDFSHLK